MDKLLNGLSVTAVGMIIVFIGLAVLILLISLLRNFSKGKAVKEEKLAQAPVPSAPEAVLPAAAVQEEALAGDELIAVLTAAIAAMWDGEQSGFVVRRVRRIHTSPAWERAGREEQIYSHM